MNNVAHASPELDLYSNFNVEMNAMNKGITFCLESVSLKYNNSTPKY